MGCKGEVVDRRLEHDLLELGYGGLAAAVFEAFFQHRAVFGPDDAGVGEEQVDVTLLLSDLVGDFGEGGFVGYVADDRFDGAVDGGIGGCLEGFFPAADDVDCFCSVCVEGAGGVEA